MERREIMAGERRKQYKGYVIFAHPEFLTDYQKWDIAFSIERHTGSAVTQRGFSVPVEDKTLFDSEQEAIEQSFVAGAQVIDRGEGLEDL